jgi:GNAT superfamily N-acetyltransferase
LCDFFDVELGPDYRRAGRYTGRRKHLVSVLRAALNAEEYKVRAEVAVSDPKNPAHKKQAEAMILFIEKLQRMYDEMASQASDTVERIEKEKKRLGAYYGGKEGSILLASLTEEPTAYVGGVCLCCGAEDKQAGRKRWQIRYLWVDPEYHRHGIGYLLLDKAIEVARKRGAVSVYVEILPASRTAAHMVSRRNFRYQRSKEAWVKGRYVFELKLTPVAE